MIHGAFLFSFHFHNCSGLAEAVETPLTPFPRCVFCQMHFAFRLSDVVSDVLDQATKNHVSFVHTLKNKLQNFVPFLGSVTMQEVQMCLVSCRFSFTQISKKPKQKTKWSTDTHMYIYICWITKVRQPQAGLAIRMGDCQNAKHLLLPHL